MRNQRLALGLGALAAVSVVVAGVVIFSDTPAAAPKGEGTAALAVSGQSLRVGEAKDAPFAVVVEEDFGNPASREFDLASRDFLRIESARGDVRVEYRPGQVAPGEYSQSGLAAYLTALSTGTPRQALAFHDELIDRQPPVGVPAPAPDVIAGWAAKVGLDRDGVQQAITSPDRAKSAAPPSGSAGAAPTVPRVTVNGTVIESGSGTSLAETLQTMIVEGER